MGQNGIDEECLENGREYCNGEIQRLKIAWNDADLNKKWNCSYTKGVSLEETIGIHDW